ncbi:hypothetical protein HO173_003456 [Letharia columbiana]|uniref:LysM domain-containing protein n=1 Tax=Letharia columbiana TaxID=112416 RepID=A0A8H6G0Y5_9LECA|nr:uncharacterized protein HO173_003456 [Letharia columbiana]KAF6238488.1 hypothetical protein HO173_003456 [Letharia columbiana]
MIDEACCCTCATLLSVISPQYDEKTEKPTVQDRRLECCGRVICGKCIADNPRFASYCPFCQVSSGPSSLPQGLRDPPAYSPPPSPRPAHATLASPPDSEEPPAYSALNIFTPLREEYRSASEAPAEDVLHFLNPSQDSLLSLSLRYGVSQDALRRKNGLFADHLLAARRTILIPGEFYKGGISLSPEPMESEEEGIRKAKVRRWMVACKVSEYDIALLYLQQSDYNLGLAVEAYLADEKWEREHPMAGASKRGKTGQKPGKRKIGMQTGPTGPL